MNRNQNLISKLVGPRLFGVGLALLVSTVANAHPGHGSATSVEGGHTLIHYLTEPVHAVGILGSVAVIIAGALLAVKHVRAVRS